MTPEFIDIDGTKHDLAWLQGKYGTGIAYHPAPLYPRFELQQVFVTEGPTILRFTVLLADGESAVGQPVAYSYPNLASPSTSLNPIPDGADKSKWFSRACIERCDPRGFHEFQIGSESWIKNQVGPYAVAVISPSTYSDCLSGTGWLGGTNHRGPCEFVFREVLSPDGGGGGGGDPATDEWQAEMLSLQRGINASLLRLVNHLGAP